VTDFCIDGDEILNCTAFLAWIFVKHRSKDDIKVDINVTEWESMDWMGQVVGFCEGGNEHLVSVKYGDLLD
jgi:hypothetical protein